MQKIAEKILNGEKPTLCFFGDSVTQGQFEFTEGYRSCVQKPDLVFHRLLADYIYKVHKKEITVLNAGVGGNFSSDGLKRITTDVLNHNPDFCCVMFGTNDVTNSRKGEPALSEYRENMRSILKKLKNHGIETVVMTPGMLCSRGVKGFTGKWFFIHKYYEMLQKKGKMDEYVEAAKQVAREENVPVVDVYAQWKKLCENGTDTTALLANGMNHPNAKMHELFASKLYDFIFEE